MNKIDKIKMYLTTHRKMSIIVLIIIILFGYWFYKKNTNTTGEVRYVLGTATKGTIITSVSGSGQVSASNQIDVKPSVSGTLTYVGIKPGNYVGNNQTLFSIDSTSAQKAVRDAEISLESAQISLNKLKIQDSNTNMNANLAQSYDDGFNNVSNVFLDLPGIMSGLNDMFFKSSPGTQQQWNIDWYEGQVDSSNHDQAVILKQNLVDSYNKAKSSYDANFDNYKIVSRTSDNKTIDDLITQTYTTTKLISDAIKNANNYIDFVNGSIQKNNGTTPTIITTHQTLLNTYTAKTNTFLLNLLSTTTSIKNYQDAFSNSDLDTQSAELSVKQKENALQDAKDNLAYYSIKAPFNGTISSVPVQKGDNVGPGTTLATLITTEQIATISLNEIDIAKIQLGQKATLTFDAIPDLTITGKVVQIDSIGTVSQGVVNYSVKISFDTNDNRVKPAMSVSAAIITGIKQDTLSVPNSAIKNQSGSSYVQMFDTALPAPVAGVQGSPSSTPPIQQLVVIGVSNDTSTEIVSGLKEGDQVVTRTITPTTTSATAPSLLGSPTNRGSSTTRIPTGR